MYGLSFGNLKITLSLFTHKASILENDVNYQKAKRNQSQKVKDEVHRDYFTRQAKGTKLIF